MKTLIGFCRCPFFSMKIDLNEKLQKLIAEHEHCSEQVDVWTRKKLLVEGGIKLLKELEESKNDDKT